MKRISILPTICFTAALSLTPTASQAVLLELTPSSPKITFGGSGIIEYDLASSTVTISGDPSRLFSLSPLITADIMGTSQQDIKDVTITFQVDSNGNVVANDPLIPDLVVQGSIDTDGDGIADYSGTLLTAEVVQFGFENGTAGTNDFFDLRLNNIGGDLAYLFSGQDLAITIGSEASPEYSAPFNGGFIANWKGPAAGDIGSTSPISAGECHLKLEAKCSENGGPFKDKCRIKVTRSPNHWERNEYFYNGNTFQMSKYGMHGSPVPEWAANYPSTNVAFKYTVTNDGQNPVSGILIEDSFDTPLSLNTPESSYPSSLEAGSSFSVIRTVELSEGIENNIDVLGTYGTGICGATDIVVVKDILRERKKYDDDDFKDKGNRE